MSDEQDLQDEINFRLEEKNAELRNQILALQNSLIDDIKRRITRE